MNRVIFSAISLISITLIPACLGKCGSQPYKYDRGAEEADVLAMFNRIGAFPNNPEIPRHTAVVCPDSVEVRDGKANFICKVSYSNGSLQNYEIRIDNGSRSLKNAT